MGVERGPRAALRPTLVPMAGVVVLLAVGTAGCTMCPDPFDYSGPVPNGSVTQNDFGARSNGILPLRAVPCPWPTVVDAAPTVAEPVAEVEAAPEESAVAESVLKVAESPDSGDVIDPSEVR